MDHSDVVISHASGKRNTPKSHRFYRFSLNGNVKQWFPFSKNAYFPTLILGVYDVYAWKSF